MIKDNKPFLINACKFSSILKEPVEEEPQELVPAKVLKRNFLLYSTVVLLVLAGVAVILYKKKGKVNEQYHTNLEKYIRNMLKIGYSEQQIRKALFKAGWKKQIVNFVFKKLK